MARESTDGLDRLRAAVGLLREASAELAAAAGEIAVSRGDQAARADTLSKIVGHVGDQADELRRVVKLGA